MNVKKRVVRGRLNAWPEITLKAFLFLPGEIRSEIVLTIYDEFELMINPIVFIDFYFIIP